MSMTTKIKMLLTKKNLSQKDLANALNITQPTLSGKYKLDDWRESDLKKIAEVCGCQYKGYFEFDDGERI